MFFIFFLRSCKDFLIFIGFRLRLRRRPATTTSLATTVTKPVTAAAPAHQQPQGQQKGQGQQQQGLETRLEPIWCVLYFLDYDDDDLHITTGTTTTTSSNISTSLTRPNVVKEKIQCKKGPNDETVFRRLGPG